MLAENLNVVAPEVVLAVFAMAGLMWGAYAGREVGGRCSGRSCAMLVAGRAVRRLPARGDADRLRRVLRLATGSRGSPR